MNGWSRQTEAERGPVRHMKFICPASMRPHAEKVFKGEYDLPIDAVATVLDVGANVGAYTVWAANRWPVAAIRSYEPDPANFDMLVQNVCDRALAGREVGVVEVARKAVAARGRMPLFRGLHNCGESTLFPNAEHHQEPACEVDCISPEELPACDVLKVDTEGAELLVIGGYPHLGTIKGVAYEWHSQSDRGAIARILKANGLRQLSDAQWHEQRGVARWVR